MPIRARHRLLTGSRKALAARAVAPPALALIRGLRRRPARQAEGASASGAVSIAKLTRRCSPPRTCRTSGAAGGQQDPTAGRRAEGRRGGLPAGADQWSSQPKHPRQVYTGALVTDTADKDKGAKSISLTVVASYKAGEAKTVLDELAAAVATCHGYYVVPARRPPELRGQGPRPPPRGSATSRSPTRWPTPRKGAAGSVWSPSSGRRHHRGVRDGARRPQDRRRCAARSRSSRSPNSAPRPRATDRAIPARPPRPARDRRDRGRSCPSGGIIHRGGPGPTRPLLTP